MSTASTKSVTNAVYRIVFYQFLMVAGFVLVFSMTKDMKSGISALAGALAYWLPTFIFTRSVAGCAGARMAGRFMIAFFGGEVFKLVLSGLLFLFAVSYLHVQLLDAVIGLVAAIVSFWIASIVSLCRQGAAL